MLYSAHFFAIGLAVVLAASVTGCEDSASRGLTGDSVDGGATDGTEDGGVTVQDGSASENPDSARSGDGPEPMLVTHSYTPEGCVHTVSTPEVSEAGPSEEILGPTPMIDHVHASWSADPATSIAINWRSDTETKVSRILYGTDRALVEAATEPSSMVMARVGHQLLYAATFIGVEMEPTRIHEVHVCGLAPDTRYFYKVGGAGAWSPVYEIATAPEPGPSATFRFGVTGDSRNHQLNNLWAMSQRRLQEAGVDFEIFSGDAVLHGALQDEWNAFFEASESEFRVESFLAETPFMPVNSNHDQLTVNYLSQFAFPQEQSPEEKGQGEQWYSFQYGNALFLMLDDYDVSDRKLDAETSWMRAQLEALDRSETPWVFVCHHEPTYTCRSTHGPARGKRAAWQPLFDEFAVDIVFNGHNHLYERSVPIRGLADGEGLLASAEGDGVPTIEDGRASGTIYLVSAGVGAGLYPASDECEFTQVAESVPSYVVVDVMDRTIRVEARDVSSDAVIDSFEYSK